MTKIVRKKIKSVSVQFFGGIGNGERTLTGSSHCLSVTYEDDTVARHVVDIGGYQGKGSKFNDKIPEGMHIGDITSLILTHGHYDHLGRLPLFFNQLEPFRGVVYASKETKLMARIALLDTAKIFQQDHKREMVRYDNLIEALKEARRVVALGNRTGIKRNSSGCRNERHDSRPDNKVVQAAQKLLLEHEVKTQKDIIGKNEPPKPPVFDAKDVEMAVRAISPISDNSWHEVSPGVSFRLYNAGHILGSRSVVFRIDMGSRKHKYVLFSGDLGSYKWQIHPSGKPETPSYPLDMVIMETTYGDRVRDDFILGLAEFRDSVVKAAERRKKLIIPSFSLDRAQLLLYYLCSFKKAGLFSGKIYVDSPLVTEYTKLYQKYAQDEEVSALKGVPVTNFKDMLKDGDFEYIDTKSRESVMASDEFQIILTSSGMANGGPILHYLDKYLGSEQHTFFFMGYMAEGTIGRALSVDQKKRITIPGYVNTIEVRSRVKHFSFLSGHADQSDLWKWLKGMKLRENSQIVLIHGELDTSTLEFKHFLERRGVENKIYMPEINKNILVE